MKARKATDAEAEGVVGLGAVAGACHGAPAAAHSARGSEELTGLPQSQPLLSWR